MRRYMACWIFLLLPIIISACGRAPAANAPQTEAATATPAATATAAATATPAPPTATPDPQALLLQLVQDAAQPNVGGGEWEVVQQDLGEGPEIRVTMPLNVLGSVEQIVRLNQTRMASVMMALFDADPALVRVNVIGTEGGQPGISLVVTRDEYASWSGIPAELPGWQVGGRFR